MQIRFAKQQDVPGNIALLRQVGRVHHEGRSDLFRADAQKYSASQVMGMLDQSSNPIFVAVEQDRVLGYGFCFMKDFSQDTVLTPHKSLYIDDLCVDESCRGQHIGKAIYHEILRYAKMRGCYNVTLSVWCCNEKAMGFYEALGLKPQKIAMETIL